MGDLLSATFYDVVERLWAVARHLGQLQPASAA